MAGVPLPLTYARTSRTTASTTLVDRHGADLAAAPVLELDLAVGQALADDDGRRDAEQLGVLERHARRHLAAVVEQHRAARAPSSSVAMPLGDRAAGPACRCRRRARRRARPTAARPGPSRRSDCSAIAAIARETPMPYDPIVTRTGLLSGPSTSRPNASAYLRPSWKMWPISMPRPIVERRAAAAARVAVAHLGGGHDAGGLEVAAHHDVDGVLARLVGAGRPRAAAHDERVDDVADALEPLRADVALDQLGVLVERRRRAAPRRA